MDHWQWNWDAGWDQSGWGSSWWSSQDWQQGYETEVTRPRSPERPPTQGASGKRGHYVKGGFVTEDDGVFRPCLRLSQKSSVCHGLADHG